jgi:uncharacterized membrane protein YvlD (DUF360 family)
MRKLLSQIVAACAGLFVAMWFVPGVAVHAYPDSNFFGFILKEQWQVILLLGVVLGLINYFLQPLLKKLSIFTILIDAGILWILDVTFDELQISVLLSLLYTALIIFALNLILSFFFREK